MPLYGMLRGLLRLWLTMTQLLGARDVRIPLYGLLIGLLRLWLIVTWSLRAMGVRTPLYRLLRRLLHLWPIATRSLGVMDVWVPFGQCLILPSPGNTPMLKGATWHDMWFPKSLTLTCFRWDGSSRYYLQEEDERNMFPPQMLIPSNAHPLRGWHLLGFHWMHKRWAHYQVYYIYG